MKCVIVSRHPAAIEFIQRCHPLETSAAPVLASATPEDVRGKVVYGNLPLHLAALAEEVWAVEFDGAPPRGAEYGVAEMEAAGARLRRYRVVADPKDRLNPPDSLRAETWSEDRLVGEIEAAVSDLLRVRPEEVSYFLYRCPVEPGHSCPGGEHPRLWHGPGLLGFLRGDARTCARAGEAPCLMATSASSESGIVDRLSRDDNTYWLADVARDGSLAVGDRLLRVLWERLAAAYAGGNAGGHVE